RCARGRAAEPGSTPGNKAAPGWVIEQFSPTAEDVAAALLAAPTEAAQQGILSEDPEAVTIDLLRTLSRRGTGLMEQDRRADAARAHTLALQIARRLGDRWEEASALHNLGADILGLGRF